MPTITISDANYSRLQSVAKPFVDTEDSTLSRVMDFYFEHNGTATTSPQNATDKENGALRLDPDAPGRLVHTRLLSASIDGQAIHRPKWNAVMQQMNLLAFKRLGSFEELRKASSANLRPGRYEENGYNYLPEGDFSVQGVSAEGAWDICLGLARILNVPIALTFEWHNKDAAAHPGERGFLEWKPKTTSG